MAGTGCSVCRTPRLLTRSRILCPKCENVQLLAKDQYIADQKEKLETSLKALQATLQTLRYNHIVGNALSAREMYASRLLLDQYNVYPRIRLQSTIRWLACSLILNRVRTLSPNKYGNKVHAKGFFDALKEAENVINHTTNLSLLRSGKAQVVSSKGKASIVPTELSHITFLPRNVERALKTNIFPRADPRLNILRPNIQGGLNYEIPVIQGLLMEPALEALNSEYILRGFKQLFPLRVLPYVNSPLKNRWFVSISDWLTTFIRLRPEAARLHNGIFLTNQDGFDAIRSRCIASFPPAAVRFYFGNICDDKVTTVRNLGAGIVFHDKEFDVFAIPRYSIELMRNSLFKRVETRSFGRYQNLSGGLLESYIQGALQSFQMNTMHPITDMPLIRVPHPTDKSVEIADLMAYDEQKLVIIESKFWDAPLLSDLELELENFYKKNQYIKDNLHKFGFTSQTQTIEVFYTPYPPYWKWKETVVLLPTVALLILYLAKYFRFKQPALVQKDPELEKLIWTPNKSIPFPLDASSLSTICPPNKKRIQDGLVFSYDDTELFAIVDNPYGYPMAVWFDIGKPQLTELRKEQVRKGDILRMGLLNLSGSWSLTQMVSFRRIRRLPAKYVSESSDITPLIELVRKKKLLRTGEVF